MPVEKLSQFDANPYVSRRRFPFALAFGSERRAGNPPLGSPSSISGRGCNFFLVKYDGRSGLARSSGRFRGHPRGFLDGRTGTTMQLTAPDSSGTSETRTATRKHNGRQRRSRSLTGTGIVVVGRRTVISRRASAIRDTGAPLDQPAVRKSVAYLNVTGIQKLARNSDVNTGIFRRK